MKNFEIDPSHLCGVVTTSYTTFRLVGDDHNLPDDIKQLFNKDQPQQVKVTGSDDHPLFKELRNTLEREGYIVCQRSWWNGDRVIKTFSLNGVVFVEGGTFWCGSAMGPAYQVAKENGSKVFPKY